MATKLNKKFVLVMLLGALGLVGCDEVTAYPDSGAILPPAQSQEIYNNELESIYESIRSGSLPSDVLDKLLYEYANTIFGRFSATAPSYRNVQEGEKTLQEVVAGSDADKEAFINAHKAYWANKDEVGDMTKAKARLQAIYDSIEERIAESLYKQISGGTYSKHNIFNERDFLAGLYFSGKDVELYTGVADDDTARYKGILAPEVEAKDVFTAGYLQKDYYFSAENTYAVDEFIETIYKQLMTEQYIIDESYTTIGRSYARKVNVLSIKVDSANPLDVPALADYLVKEVITKKDGTNYRFNSEDDVQALYASVSKIMRGLPKYFGAEKDDTAYDAVNYLYTNYGLYGNPATVDADHPLTSTEFGAMQKEIAKINDNLSLTDSSVESSYTGSGAYTVQKGIEYKQTEIELKNYTTNGWYIKNGGLTSLPETIRSKLFNHAVAVALDNNKEGYLKDRADLIAAGNWDAKAYDAEVKDSKYVARVNGTYFLKSDTLENKDSNKDLYFYDSGSSTYYFVQIEEAVNSAKLSESDESYSVDDKAAIARSVCKVVGESSTYETLAKEHWLEKMALEYHDQAVYDYFKSNFPKLFDDED